MSNAVTTAEESSYWQFVLSLIQQRLSGRLPAVLWHYTNGVAIIEIIKSRSLYATQIACVNDTTEFRYSINMLVEAFARQRPRATNPDEITLIDYVLTNISADTVTSEWFITCFSKRKDDLSQWRAYSGGENGYAIGFDARSLISSIGRPNYFLGPVNYDPVLHAQIADQVAAATVTFYLQGLSASGRTPNDWMPLFLAAWSKAIGYLAPVIKHPKFADEEEWRIFHSLEPADTPDMIYRQKRTLMSRHLPIQLSTASHGESALLMPIAEIMVGPSRHKNVSRVSVGDLMRTLGYGQNFNVTMSDVPFQET